MLTCNQLRLQKVGEKSAIKITFFNNGLLSINELRCRFPKNTIQ